MFCIQGMRNCVLHTGLKRTDDRCGRCGFNLDEYNRRIADIRANGLERVGKDRFGAYVWGYRVKRGSERMKQNQPYGAEQTSYGGNA